MLAYSICNHDGCKLSTQSQQVEMSNLSALICGMEHHAQHPATQSQECTEQIPKEGPSGQTEQRRPAKALRNAVGLKCWEISAHVLKPVRFNLSHAQHDANGSGKATLLGITLQS